LSNETGVLTVFLFLQECLPFWPLSAGASLVWDQQLRITLVDEMDTSCRRAIRLSLEVSWAYYIDGLEHKKKCFRATDI